MLFYYYRLVRLVLALFFSLLLLNSLFLFRRKLKFYRKTKKLLINQIFTFCVFGSMLFFLRFAFLCSTRSKYFFVVHSDLCCFRNVFYRFLFFVLLIPHPCK